MEHPKIPERIGHFRVVEALGEGGMGTVYVGVDETLDRRVALKLIRAEHRLNPVGKARFLREAKILSRLDHPGICKLYDFIEGDDEDCLVLELVEGTSLLRAMTEISWTYQDKLQIARKLLDVLVVVHGEGIIHRDLTPLNVMITPSADVKVLDFGLARVADAGVRDEQPPAPSDVQSLDFDHDADQGGRRTLGIDDEAEPETERHEPPTGACGISDDLETRHGAILGTAAYMSPEQARGEAVTAASDMYSYGLILQELFTDRPPYPPNLGRRELRRRAILSETEPITGLPADLTEMLERLTSFFPASRPSSVDTAEMLQAIIDRPVRQRRKLLVAAVWLALSFFGIGMTVQFLRAERESERAEQHAARAEAEAAVALQVSDFLTGLFEVSDPGRGDGSEITARELLDAGASRIDSELAGQPVVHARLTHTMGVVYHHLGDLERAHEMLTTALDERELALGPDHVDVAETLFQLGLIDRYLSHYDQALEAFTRGLEIVRLHAGPDCLESARFLHQLAILDKYRGDLDGAEARLDRALSIYQSDPDDNARGVSESLTGLASIHAQRKQYDEAEEELRRAMELHRQVHGPDSLEEAGDLSELGSILIRVGRFDEAEQAIRRSLTITEERLGADHPFTAGSVNALAHFFYSQGRYDEAVEQLRRALQIYTAVYGSEHPDTATALTNLGMVVARQGDLAEAERLLTESLAIMSSTRGPSSLDTSYPAWELAKLKEKLNKIDDAETLYRQVLAIQEESLGPDSAAATATRKRLEAL